jgi:hypothetical protein
VSRRAGRYRQGDLQPGGVDRELPGLETAEAGGFTRADPVLDAGMRAVPDLQEVHRTAAVRCVGGEHLMPHPVDRVNSDSCAPGWGVPAGRSALVDATITVSCGGNDDEAGPLPDVQAGSRRPAEHGEHAASGEPAALVHSGQRVEQISRSGDRTGQARAAATAAAATEPPAAASPGGWSAGRARSRGSATPQMWGRRVMTTTPCAARCRATRGTKTKVRVQIALNTHTANCAPLRRICVRSPTRGVFTR